MTCPRCGAALEAPHRFCWNCGLPRQEQAPPPLPHPARTAATPAEPGVRPPVPGIVAFLALLAAAGAVFFLVSVVQMAAYLVHPGGIQALYSQSSQSGIPQPGGIAAFTSSAVFGFVVFTAVALLHLATFITLQRRTQIGWVLAVLLSALWSLLLVGIPFLVALLRHDTRRAFGLN